jgi:hypothetical protein
LGPDLLLVKETMYAESIDSLVIVPSTILISRDFFDRIGGIDEAFTRVSVEDIEFVLRCVQQAPIGVVTRPMVGMRRHGANAAGDRFRDLRGTVKILDFARAHHPLAPQYANLIDEHLLRDRLEAADLAFSAGQYALVRELMQPIPDAERPWKAKVKMTISSMPEPFRTVLAKATLRFPKKLPGLP